MNMRKWRSDVIANPVKKAMPVLSFPATQLMDISVLELLNSSELQAKGMKMIADRCDAGIAAGMMDLSVEAEAFGCSVVFADNEVPRADALDIKSLDDINAIAVPKVGAGRTGSYVDGIAKAKSLITDRPVIANVIGPYSLAGNLMDVSKFMKACMKNIPLAKAVLEKCTEFLIAYALAYKEAGADGIILAEPLPGLISPKMNASLSLPYVKELVAKIQDDNFSVIYHNCGQNAGLMVTDIAEINAAAYHFGNKVDMHAALSQLPADSLVMGNLDPAEEFFFGTPESVRKATLEQLDTYGKKYPNYVISSGCDIPHMANWETIDAFFATVNEYYGV